MSIIRILPRYLARLIPPTLAALIAAGCSAAKSEQPVVAPAGSRENGMLVLSPADNNRIAQVKIGERFTVRLPSNPATGFTWAVDENDGRLLKLENTNYAEPSEPGIVGARGRQIFTFSARRVGETAVKFKYWRFWDGDASVTERYVVTLQIRE